MAALDRRQFLVSSAGAVVLWPPAEPAGFSRRALRELRAAVRGRVHVPRGSASLVYNTRFDGRRPDAVVEVRDTADVAAAVRWANRFDVPLVARSGGHSYAGYCTTADGVVLDLSRLRGIRVANGRATVGPAAQLIDVQRALTRRGLTVPSGSCPSVGIGGLALGGGHGLAGRRFGLTSDNLVAARVVTADGRVRRVDADTNEDLYWACRGGGGGNFGIVTSLALRTHRAAGAAYFFVSWPWSQAGEAIAAWQLFAPHAPPTLTSILSLGTTGGSGTPRVSALGQYFGEPAALERLLRPLTRVAGAGLTTGSSSYFTMVLRWAGCLDGGLPACHRSTRSSDRLGRAPPAHAVARLGRAPLGRIRRRAQPPGGRRHGVRAPRHAVLAAVPRVLQRRRGGPGEPALDQRGLGRPSPARLRGGVPELHRPGPRALAAGLLRVEPRAAAPDQEAAGPGLPLPLSPGDPARALMDRDSLRRLRAQPGYLGFVSAATLARVSDEMFGVGVVLLVLDRTGNEALAGAAVAAVTLPSLVTGPLLGAWLDLTGRRRTLMVVDQLTMASVLLALVILVGHAPAWAVLLAVLPAGTTFPLSFGGFTSMIPSLVPGELLPPANALETTSFNSALVVGPALAGTLSATVAPAAPLV